MKHLLLGSFAVVNRPLIVLAVTLVGTLLPIPTQVRGVTDEDTRKAFLESRHTDSDAKAKSASAEEEKTPAKAKHKKAKPKPAKRKRHHQDEEETPVHHKAKPEPEATPNTQKREEETPAPTPAQRETPSAKPSEERSHVSVATPHPSAPAPAAVVIQKSNSTEEEPVPTPTPEQEHHWRWWPFGHVSHYKYLTPAIRDAIDNAPVATHPARWRYIVVHNSGTRQGNAKAFDYYHRYVRKMPNGLAYHFVIGNGTSSGNGAIEIGSRWTRQINGGHVHSDYLNNIALGICLVGDFNHDQPTPQQLEALEELIKYLRGRVGKTDHKPAVVKAHKDINPAQWPTDCPGDKFPYAWLARFY